MLSLKLAFLWEISDFRRDADEVYPPHRAVTQCCWVVLCRLFGTSSSSIFIREAVRASLNHENWTEKSVNNYRLKLHNNPEEWRPLFHIIWIQNEEFLHFWSCTITNKCTIISQIITLLHVSTLSCHPHGTCNQYLAKLHKYFKCNRVILLIYS